MDIDIELLQLNIEGASGQEHRVRAIAARAAEILASHLDERQPMGSDRDGKRVPEAGAGTVKLDLSRTSNERAALSIAAAWLEAINAKLEAGA